MSAVLSTIEVLATRCNAQVADLLKVQAADASAAKRKAAAGVITSVAGTMASAVAVGASWLFGAVTAPKTPSRTLSSSRLQGASTPSTTHTPTGRAAATANTNNSSSGSASSGDTAARSGGVRSVGQLKSPLALPLRANLITTLIMFYESCCLHPHGMVQAAGVTTWRSHARGVPLPVVVPETLRQMVSVLSYALQVCPLNAPTRPCVRVCVLPRSLSTTHC